MKVLVLAVVMLFVSVPAYAQEVEYDHDASKEIILKGKVLAFGAENTMVYMSVKYKGRLFYCVNTYIGQAQCSEWKLD